MATCCAIFQFRILLNWQHCVQFVTRRNNNMASRATEVFEMKSSGNPESASILIVADSLEQLVKEGKVTSLSIFT